MRTEALDEPNEVDTIRGARQVQPLAPSRRAPTKTIPSLAGGRGSMSRRAGIAISVGMPVYNGEQYAELAIRSILEQTLPDFELIISDNASTDRTEEICRDLAGQDERIVYTRNDHNMGAAWNYNRVYALASGKYFRWANADDVSATGLHSACFETLEDDQEAVLCHGHAQLIDSDGRFLEDYADKLDLRQRRPSERFIRFFESLGLTNAIYGLMRSSAMRRTALMGDGRYPAADITYMAELALYGKFLQLPETLFFRRMHPDASSADRSDEARQVTFWTGRQGSFVRPTWRKHAALARAVARSRIPLSDKARSLLYVVRRLYWDRREVLTEFAGSAASRMSRQRS